MLETIDKALEEQLEQPGHRMSPQDRMSSFSQQYPKKIFTRKDYMKMFRQISMATASRDLKWAVDARLIQKIGDKRTTQYLFNDPMLPVNDHP
jgi:predicted HTH transcriptional regulator